MSYSLKISAASQHDVKDIVDLVNSAYRGEASKQGWTTEADLLSGIRTDEKAITDIITHIDNTILICRNEQDGLVGCVHLQKQAREMYLGMLTVSPRLQGGGIGKELLKKSEIFSREANATSIVMNVISVRHELISWYERHGYERTGETKPFPFSNPRFGIPKQPLEFLVLKKNLQAKEQVEY
jgi:N-acetylglutamate synthase-like GNAT family acetyltransferase